MSVPTNVQLEGLVKYCILDGALIKGIPLESCIGHISEKVVYNNISIMVDVDIEKSDIAAFFKTKAANCQYCF